MDRAKRFIFWVLGVHAHHLGYYSLSLVVAFWLSLSGRYSCGANTLWLRLWNSNRSLSISSQVRFGFVIIHESNHTPLVHARGLHKSTFSKRGNDSYCPGLRSPSSFNIGRLPQHGSRDSSRYKGIHSLVSASISPHFHSPCRLRQLPVKRHFKNNIPTSFKSFNHDTLFIFFI